MIVLAAGCQRTIKFAIFALGDEKVTFLNYEKYGTLSIPNFVVSKKKINFLCLEKKTFAGKNVMLICVRIILTYYMQHEMSIK